VLGFSGSATIVGQRTLGKYKDLDNYEAIRNSIEALGICFTYENKKRYFLGQLPIADAFIAWSNSLNIDSNAQRYNWRIKFQLLSLFLILLIIVINKSIFTNLLQHHHH
jgi:hypothetical protein